MNINNGSLPTIQKSFKAWLVCLTAALYFFYIFLQMTKFNAIGASVLIDFHLNSESLGVLSSMFFWGNLIFLFPAGLLLDRFSSKKILMINMSLLILCTLLFSFTRNFFLAAVFLFLIGIAGAFGLLLPLRLVSRWFLPKQMGLASGIVVTIGFLGGMVSQTPLTLLVNYVGWHHAMQWLSIFGACLLGLMAIVVEDFPEGIQHEMSRDEMSAFVSLLSGLKKALSNYQNWLLGLYVALLNLSIFIFGAVFGIRYLEQVDAFSASSASSVMVVLFLGAMLGSPVLGWISDRLGRRKLPMFVSALLALILILLIIYLPHMSFSVAMILFFLLGFCTSGQVIGYPMVTESNSPKITGVSLSIVSIFLMLSGAIFLPLFGKLLDLFWKGKMIAGVPFHTVFQYQIALWMLPIAIILAIIALFFVKETYCRPLD